MADDARVTCGVAHEPPPFRLDMKRSSSLLSLCLLAVVIAAPANAAPANAAPASALAQWQWRDANGRMVYSDVPPPPSVTSIVRAPGQAAGEFRPVEAAPAQSEKAEKAEKMAQKPASKSADKPAPTEEEAFQQRRAARLKAANEEATKEREAAERETRCAELRNYASGLQQGMRAAVAGPDGSLQRMDAEQRQAEMLKTSTSLEKNCN